MNRSLTIGFVVFIIGGLLILTMRPALFAIGILAILAGALLPIVNLSQRSSADENNVIVVSGKKRTRPAVLIIEDQSNWRNTLQLALQDRYSVQTTSNLLEARELLFESGQPFHVAVVDIRLDDSDPSNQEGLVLAEEIRKKLDGFTTTIVITAYPSITSVKRALRLGGVFEYVEKYPHDGTGFDLQAFQNIVHKAAQTAARIRGEATPRVLIIEDEHNWQQMLTTLLEQEEFDVEVADTYQKARSRIHDQVYDLFVVDLRLVEVSPEQGMELLNEIERFNIGAKAIIVSGFGTSQLIRRAFAEHKSSVEDFFSKDAFDQTIFLNAARRATSSSNSLSFQLAQQGEEVQ